MKQLFVKVKTTGLDYKKNGIHRITGLIVEDGKEVDSFDYKVQPNPYCIIEPEALRYSGVTEKEIKEYPLMQDVHLKLKAKLSNYVNEQDYEDMMFLCGYNVRFDSDFLRAFFKQNRDSSFGSLFWSNELDVMALATQELLYKRKEMKNFKMYTVAETLGLFIDAEFIGDAVNDLHICKEIYDKITKK